MEGFASFAFWHRDGARFANALTAQRTLFVLRYCNVLCMCMCARHLPGVSTCTQSLPRPRLLNHSNGSLSLMSTKSKGPSKAHSRINKREKSLELLSVCVCVCVCVFLPWHQFYSILFFIFFRCELFHFPFLFLHFFSPSLYILQALQTPLFFVFLVNFSLFLFVFFIS